MHDTAMEIGSRVMNRYSDLPNAAILELGSYDVNGSLKTHATDTTQYIGLDLEAGPGVDFVVEASKPWPVDDDAFDLVIASSVFEHDSLFWMTFLQMVRKARPGGYIYINSPSNGSVHRHPEDNWRFYPDSGRALERWAIHQGQAVTLVESFTAARKG
jgi:SAM-dependent methyltransferase